MQNHLFRGAPLALSVLLILGALTVSGCSSNDEPEVADVIPDGKGEEPVWDKDSVSLSGDIAPYFESGDIAYHDITAVSTTQIMGSMEDEIVAAKNESQGSTGTEWAETWEEITPIFHWYAVGAIAKTGSEYEGQELLLLNLECEGPCFSRNIYRFAWDETTGALTFLVNHSKDYQPDYLVSLFENADTTTTFDGVTLPDEITISGVDATANGKIIELAQQDQDYLQELSYPVAFTDPEVGNVYFAADGDGIGCFYVQAADGSVARYDYEPGFGFLSTKEDPQPEETVTWNDGTTDNLTTTYTYVVGGCGISGNCYLTVERDPANLEVVGETSAGIQLYAVKDAFEGAVDEPSATPEQVAFDESYEGYKGSYQYRVENEGYTLLTFDEYVDLKPLLYWQDPFGRWSAITHIDVRPMVECGKPVIYLYPTEPTTVSVQVGIDELTVTIPDYGQNGWTVNANPDGSMVNTADGLTYPYLFWEGKSYDGVDPTEGFMIARKDLKNFLQESLMKLGLNAQERTDFMDFWLSRMLDNSEKYFFISFLGTQEFNPIAPLTITPQPNTLMRVFMYYHPTSTPFKVTKQTLTATERRGFTVVEWGGTSSRPWTAE